MNYGELRTHICEALAANDRCAKPRSRIRNCDRLDDDLDVDSIAIVEICLHLEAMVPGLYISPEDVQPLRTVQHLITATLERNQAQLAELSYRSLTADETIHDRLQAHPGSVEPAFLQKRVA